MIIDSNSNALEENALSPVAKGEITKKRMFYTIIFCLWIGLNYFGVWGDSAQKLAHNLALYRDPPLPLSTFQMWFFNILGHIYDSVFVAVATGIFAYHFRDLKTWQYVALAIFVRYFPILFFLPFALWNHSLSQILNSAREFGPTYELVIMAALQLAFAIVAALVGVSYGQSANYLDEKDEERGFIGGISKKMWALLTILFNPVVRFVTQLSIVVLYQFSKDVASSAYWKAMLSNFFSFSSSEGDDSSSGIFGLIVKFMFVWFIWLVTFVVFYAGAQTIRDKAKRYRLLIILAIFVALPGAITIIPLIRNRTWFF